MRTEKEMMDLILDVAEKDERIRAVYMNGSRTNPTLEKDLFQDYDIVYVVADMDAYLEDEMWVDVFGERLMMQEPDKNDGEGERVTSDFYGYLMLFADGNRIDLHLETLTHMEDHYGEDKLTIPLLDKDDCLPAIPNATDEDYHVKKPSEQEYLARANNFWWCQQNVAKSLWRDEVPYAQFMLECVIRRDLNQMVSWWIGIQTDFKRSTGKAGNYFKPLLPESYWNMYEATFAGGYREDVWEALFKAGGLFRTLALEVAETYSYSYPEKDDENMTAYLKKVRGLPADAERIF